MDKVRNKLKMRDCSTPADPLGDYAPLSMHIMFGKFVSWVARHCSWTSLPLRSSFEQDKVICYHGGPSVILQMSSAETYNFSSAEANTLKLTAVSNNPCLYNEISAVVEWGIVSVQNGKRCSFIL